MFYEANDYPQAMVYFTKEHDAWPESAVFMEKMIRDSKAMIDKAKPKGS
jgi:hypothetical protein